MAGVTAIRQRKTSQWMLASERGVPSVTSCEPGLQRFAVREPDSGLAVHAIQPPRNNRLPAPHRPHCQICELEPLFPGDNVAQWEAVSSLVAVIRKEPVPLATDQPGEGESGSPEDKETEAGTNSDLPRAGGVKSENNSIFKFSKKVQGLSERPLKLQMYLKEMKRRT